MDLRRLKKRKHQLSLSINKKLGSAFRFCSPVLKFLIGLFNGAFTLLGCVLMFSAIVMYIVPQYHVFIDSLKSIFNVHTIFGTAIVLGFITIIVGCLGIVFLLKKQYEKLGLQAATFLVFLIVLAAILFSFWSEWEANAHYGIIHATQSYNPHLASSIYFKSIQIFLQCCGSQGPGDYDIGNEPYARGYVPASCCDPGRHPSRCVDLQLEGPTVNGSQPRIAKTHARTTGCMSRMETIIWPAVVYSLSLHAAISMVCMLITAGFIVGYHTFMHTPKTTNSADHLGSGTGVDGPDDGLHLVDGPNHGQAGV